MDVAFLSVRIQNLKLVVLKLFLRNCTQVVSLVTITINTLADFRIVSSVNAARRKRRMRYCSIFYSGNTTFFSSLPPRKNGIAIASIPNSELPESFTAIKTSTGPTIVVNFPKRL